MKGKSKNVGSEKAPDENAEHNKDDARIDTLHESEESDEGFSRGGKTKKKREHRKHGGHVEGKAEHKRGDKKERRGKFNKGGKVDGRAIETIAKGGDKEKTESEARHVKMRKGWAVNKIDREDD